MSKSMMQTFRASWRRLIIADLLFKVIAFVVLTPIVSSLFRAFMFFSGSEVLADTDIIYFLIHPLGWLAVISLGGGFFSILAFEQSVLMSIYLAASRDRNLSIRESFQFVGSKTLGIFQLAARIAVRLLLLTAPFLIAGGGLYFILLTEHDINFYLAQQPPQFWIAVVSIGALLAVLTVILIRCLIHWSVAIPLLLFEDCPANECLSVSRSRVQGHRTTILKWLILWFAAQSLIASAGSTLIIYAGQALVPSAAGRLWTIVLVLGAVILAWLMMNLVTSMFAAVTFAGMYSEVYTRFGQGSHFSSPGHAAASLGLPLKWTRTRLAFTVVIAVLVAGLIGALSIRSIRLVDDVEVTAHRAGAARAPENTLAAVRQAIKDQADWIEIDVQETRDGVVVVAHDSDLMKVAGVSTKIWEATLDELKSVDIGSRFDPAFKDERLPTLAELLAECRGRVRVNIELKYYGHNQNLEQKVVDLVEQAAMESDVVIMSLNREGIEKIQRLRPQWTVGLLTAVKIGDLTRTKVDFLAVNSKLAKRSLIRSAHRREKQIHAWTVNDPVMASMLISRGVDNLITDDPAMVRQVLADRADMSPVERVLVELAFLFGVTQKQTSQQ